MLTTGRMAGINHRCLGLDSITGWPVAARSDDKPRVPVVATCHSFCHLVGKAVHQSTSVFVHRPGTSDRRRDGCV
jgi:hypothetical protein